MPTARMPWWVFSPLSGKPVSQSEPCSLSPPPCWVPSLFSFLKKSNTANNQDSHRRRNKLTCSPLGPLSPSLCFLSSFLPPLLVSFRPSPPDKLLCKVVFRNVHSPEDLRRLVVVVYRPLYLPFFLSPPLGLEEKLLHGRVIKSHSSSRCTNRKKS